MSTAFSTAPSTLGVTLRRAARLRFTIFLSTLSCWITSTVKSACCARRRVSVTEARGGESTSTQRNWRRSCSRSAPTAARARRAGGLGGRGPAVRADMFFTFVGCSRELRSAPQVQHGAPQVAIQDDGALPGDRQQLGQVEEGGGLALLGSGPRHQHHVADVPLASEEEGGAERLVGLGRDVEAFPAVAGDGREEVEVEIALHVLAVLDRVGDVVPQEHVARSQDQSDQGPREGNPALLGGEGS